MSAFLIGFFWLIVAIVIALFDSDEVATFFALMMANIWFAASYVKNRNYL